MTATAARAPRDQRAGAVGSTARQGATLCGGGAPCRSERGAADCAEGAAVACAYRDVVASGWRSPSSPVTRDWPR